MIKRLDDIITVLSVTIITGNCLFWCGLKLLGYVLFGLGGAILLLKLTGARRFRKRVIPELIEMDDKTVIYRADDDGRQTPVATIHRHKDCPKEVYAQFWEEMIEED